MGHSQAICSFQFSPDGQMIASGSGDKTSKLWRLSDGRLIDNFTEYTKPVWSVVISPDGQTIASGSGDQTIKLWSIKRDTTSQTHI